METNHLKKSREKKNSNTNQHQGKNNQNKNQIRIHKKYYSQLVSCYKLILTYVHGGKDVFDIVDPFGEHYIENKDKLEAFNVENINAIESLIINVKNVLDKYDWFLDNFKIEHKVSFEDLDFFTGSEKLKEEETAPRSTKRLSDLITDKNSVDIVASIKVKFKNIKGKRLKLLLLAF